MHRSCGSAGTLYRDFSDHGWNRPFKSASGILTFTETVVPLLADASQNPVFFTSTGGFTGMVSGVDTDEDPDGRR